jgi:hypothetical protein
MRCIQDLGGEGGSEISWVFLSGEKNREGHIIYAGDETEGEEL